MEKLDYNNKIKELTLLMVYLQSWEENEFGIKYRRSWKGYDFNILDELSSDGLISNNHRSKSVGIGDDGIKKAKELLRKYGYEE